MSIPSSIRLVKSLSSSEKRFFKLHTRQQGGYKDYIGLFDIIESNAGAEEEVVKKAFKKEFPKTSIDNTSRYLVKILTDCLVESKIDKDPFFELMQGLMRTKVLQERSLVDESKRYLKRLREQAKNSQHHFIEYLTYRYELNFLTDSNFQGTNDRTLVESQMKAKDILKSLNHIQDHHSLFELLKYRLVYSGKISSDNDKKRLNDLVLSEMTLVTGKTKNSFAAQKLHLLFQSFFFTDIGDYQSALKTFDALNRVFEQNLSLLDHPPADYLSALNGILDSLMVLEKYEEMIFYIDKVNNLDQAVYPEYFRYQAKKTAAVFQLAILTGNNQFREALDFVNKLDKSWMNMYSMVDEEKQWELYFYCSLACFGNREWKQAHDFIRKVMNNHKLQSQLLICKAIRLLDILIYFEKGDRDYLEYEIRSYKRFFKEEHKPLKAETILFKFISNAGILKRKKLPELQHKKMSMELDSLQKDKYEKQLLKYFDFTNWVRARI